MVEHVRQVGVERSQLRRVQTGVIFLGVGDQCVKVGLRCGGLVGGARTDSGWRSRNSG